MPIPTVREVAEVVGHKFGVVVTDVKRQTRWRPTWFVTATRDGKDHSMVIRGDRVDSAVFPLRHEWQFHSLLEHNGIAVAKLHGYVDEIDAVAMEMLPGRPDFHDVSDSERDVIVDEYLKLLVAVHSLDPQQFADAGILRAARPEESAMVAHEHMERIFRSRKTAPDPFMEFCLGWLHRNPPRSNGREAPIIWDTGQFHHHNGHLVAALDFEFGIVGDPMLDLATWRMRDTLIPFGDFDKLYERYGELSGTPVDMQAIKLHHFACTIGNQLMFGPSVIAPDPDTDLMNNMQWNSETNLHATETLAEFLDIELPVVEMPEPRRTRQNTTYPHLVRSLKVETDDYLLRHDLRLAFRMARHLQRTNEIADAIVEADLDDLGELLNHRPETFWEGDAELERFVLADATVGKYDEQLVRLFHRRNLRVHMQLGPEGSSMVQHYRLQRFEAAPISRADEMTS